MLFGDQAGRPPLALRQKIQRAIQRALRDVNQNQANLPIEYQIKRAIAVVVGASGATGAAAKSAYDYGLSFYNSRSEETTPPSKSTREIAVTPDTEPRMSKRLNFDDDEDMSMAVEMARSFSEKPSTEAARSGGGTTNTVGGGETEIDQQKPHYGIPFTTTVVLPFTTYLTAVTNSNDNLFNFYFRLNSPWDPFITNVTTPTANATLGAGVFNRKLSTTGTTWPASLVTFPQTLTAGGPNNERPQWRQWYSKLYNKYAVLGCEYELTCENPRATRHHDVTMALGVETLSAANGGRVFPGNVPVASAEFWPGLDWHVIKSRSDGDPDSAFTVVRGRYVPGSKETNVQNDEDIKTWTTVGSTPTLTEQMNVMIAQSAFNQTQQCQGIHVKLKLKYIVQFKDISVNAMFPATQTDIVFNMPTDIVQSSG